MAKRFYRSIFPWVVLVHTGLFLAFWLTNTAFYAQTNDYLNDRLGLRLDYIRLCLWAAAGLAVWSAARLLFYRQGSSRSLRIITDILYGLAGLVFVAFFYGSYWLLFRESPAQQVRLIQLILYHRLILDIAIVIAAAALGALWLRRTLGRPPAPDLGDRLLSIAAVLSVFALIWVLGIAFPPDSVYQGELPLKPMLLAHRGASFQAPENTLASTELAARMGVHGVESDLRISLDGFPFVMHDEDLKRTTDVAEVFPGRQNDRAETFTLSEVRQLNAGQWFLNVDPYRSIARRAVSNDQAQSYQDQAVPSLADQLEVVRQHELFYMFDLKPPPDDHPYRDLFSLIVLRQIQVFEIDRQILFLANLEQADLIRVLAPQMTLVHGTNYQRPWSASDLIGNGYQVVNAEYNLDPEWITEYQQAGLWVNLYTVDEPWQYSRLWQMGVNSITSSNPGAMVALHRPVLGLSAVAHFTIWTLLSFTAAVLSISAGTLAAWYKRRVPALPAEEAGQGDQL
jgi:glycerophosphoryl diester phosphodiesterase